MRRPVLCHPGSFALLAKGGIPRISIPTVAYPTLCQERKGWGTRLFVVLPAVSNTNRGLIENLFLIKKPHEACQRHQSRQEIRGSAVEGSQFQSFAQPLLSGIYSANFQLRTLAVPHAEPSRPRRSPPEVSLQTHLLSRQRWSRSLNKLPWFPVGYSNKESWKFTIPIGCTGSTLTTTQLCGPSNRTCRSAAGLCSNTRFSRFSLLPDQATYRLLGRRAKFQEG